LVANYRDNKVFPDAISDAFFKTNDPFPARDIERIFPDRPSDTLVEQEIVCGRLEGRGRREVGPERPKRLDLGWNERRKQMSKRKQLTELNAEIFLIPSS